MGIVQLDYGLVWKILKERIILLEAPDKIRDRGCGKEIFLFKPELTPHGRGVVGIEHFGDVLGEHLLVDRMLVVAIVEIFQIEFFGSPRRPKT